MVDCAAVGDDAVVPRLTVSSKYFETGEY